MLDNVIDLETREENGPLGGTNGFVTYKAMRLHDQELIDALGAVAMTTDGRLALVNEVKAKRTYQGLEVLVWVQLLAEFKIERVVSLFSRGFFVLRNLHHRVGLLLDLFFFQKSEHLLKLEIPLNRLLAAVFVLRKEL